MIKLISSRNIQEGQSIGLTINHQNIMLVRKRNKVFAYHNRCPHMGINLEWQPHVFLDHSGNYIQCSNHGALFEINNGQCIYGPCLHQKLETIKTQEFDGYIWSRDL